MKLDVKKMKLEMARKELSPSDLSKASGITLTTIYNYTSAKRNPSIRNLGKICKAMNIDVTDLLEE